jgi:mitochondrial fission protein ELM1
VGLASGEPLSIWAVADGRAGIVNQVQGVAEAVARLTPAEITLKRIGWKAYLDPLPARWNPAPRWGMSSGSSDFSPPWPDLMIAAGRASLPLSIQMRKWSQGRTFVVQLQDPRLPADLFDMVVPPLHDELSGAGIFPIVGSPHRVTPERLAEDFEIFRSRIAPLPRPRVAVLVGGKSKAFDITATTAEALADQIARMVEGVGGSVLLTTSRRTPASARAILTARLSTLPGILWNGEAPNPYFAFLAAADVVVATEDSINMVAEAASTGKPIHIASVNGKQRRKRLFHADLFARGVAQPFTGEYRTWTYATLRETDRLADQILTSLTAHTAKL